jgi:hemerythrin-like domain-containing protein
MIGGHPNRGLDVTIQLADLLADLREDHRNMTIMLDLLERESDRIRDGEKPDYELIHDIMRYMTVYSDAVHHPKENLLYAQMKTENPDLAEGLARVLPEHTELAQLGEALRNDVEAVSSGAAVTRQRIVADTANYVAYLKEHMSWEENDLFREADSLLNAEEAMFVDISQLDKLDPVFGPEREHSFANLLENIRAFAEDSP